MTDLRYQLQGLWLPLVTPFRDGELDETSLRRLVRHYAAGPVDGLILAATSGEGMTLDMAELERLVSVVRAGLPTADAHADLSRPVGAVTAKMFDALDETAAWPIDGYLIASPYYIRPSQRGLLQHFTALADHASWPIVLYNIPYRTAVDRERHAAAARGASQHRRHEGLLRRPRAVDRPAAAAAGGLSGADRRGRAISQRADRRRRRRDPAVGPYRDRCLCGGAHAGVGRQPGRGAAQWQASPDSPDCCSLSQARRRRSTGWRARADRAAPKCGCRWWRWARSWRRGWMRRSGGGGINGAA